MWEFYSGRGTMQAADMKLHTLELFSLLLNEKEILPGARARTFYTRSQVDIAHETERIITVDIQREPPCQRAGGAFRYKRDKSKNYFRGVFGSNISVYIQGRCA
ncbi:MAG: hypothetical protein V8Q42_10860 [Anaerovoracaceae bacterium]